MHMYEYLLFELKSEHVFSMPGFKHVAMEKKYTQYLLSDLENKWFSKNSAAQAADPLAAPKTAAKAKKDFFSRGEWAQDRFASFGRNTGNYHTLGKAQC